MCLVMFCKIMVSYDALLADVTDMLRINPMFPLNAQADLTLKKTFATNFAHMWLFPRV